MISNELQQTFDDGGITDDVLIEKYVKAMDIAESNLDPKAMQGILDKLAEYRGWNNKTTLEAEDEFDYTMLEGDMEKKGRAKLRASKEVREVSIGDADVKADTTT